jgi:hypothetical protein
MNRRAAPRFPLHAEVVLVTAGPDGPELSTGRTIEVSLGGCSVQLDEPLEGATTSGVLLVRIEGRELTMLTAPISGSAAAADRLGLRFVAPTEPDGAWSELVDRLAA